MSIEALVGKTLESVSRVDDEAIIFVTTEGPDYRMWHRQDCCERVYVEDVNGDLQDLVGSPILTAEELTSEPEPAEPHDDESQTWTFYRLSTIKGTVTIRWYGTSNGYYSESVDFDEV
jgi:hypothetical protein